MLVELIKYNKNQHSEKLSKIISTKYLKKYTNKLFPYSLIAFFGLEKNFLYLLSDEDKLDLIGMIVLRKRIDNKMKLRYYIYGVEVFEDYRGKGYGSQLIENIIKILISNKIKQVYLYVERTNEIAISLYKKYGFKIIADNSLRVKVLMCKILF